METKPKTLREYPGQEDAKKMLFPALEATLKHGKPFPHVIISGPPGIGKTVLAHILAAELGTKMVELASRQIKTAMDFINVAASLRDNDVLFLEEIHGLDKDIEEEIYKAVDDFGYWYTVKDKQIWLPFNHFVLVGATTRLGSMSQPLVSRFGIAATLRYYTIPELAEMTMRYGSRMGLLFEDDAAEKVAEMSRGVARKMTKLVDFVHTLALNSGTTIVNVSLVKDACERMGINKAGLTRQDMEFLNAIRINFSNKPVGLASLAATLGDSVENLESTVEPFLVRNGLVIRTTRGRMLTERGQKIASWV